MCKCVSIIAEGPRIDNIVPHYLCSCDCNVHQKCKTVCEFDNYIDFYDHPIICKKQYSTIAAADLGFFGNGLHFGIEIEFETNFDYEQFHHFLDNFANSELTKYFVVSPEISVPRGIEFISAPMNYFYHSIYLVKLYDFINNYTGMFFSSEKTGIHMHLTKGSFQLQNLIDYIQSNSTEIDKYAGRKENNFCLRSFTEMKTKTNALRETEKTIELRIFKTFETSRELLNRIKILERLIC